MSVLLIALLLQPSPAAERVRAEVQDAPGDAEPSFTATLSPDLRSASVEASTRGLRLTVRFTPHTFRKALTYVQFSFNLGQGPGGGNDQCQRCGNYLVDINGVSGRSTEAQVQRLSDDSKYELAGTVPISFVAQGVDVVIPWSLLPKGASRLTYQVVTCIKLRDDALTRILDRMPDIGAPAPTLEWR